MSVSHRLPVLSRSASWVLLAGLCLPLHSWAEEKAEEEETAGGEELSKPRITRVEPFVMPAQGGEKVAIAGHDFRVGAVVKFGGEPATEVSVKRQGTVLEVTVPPGEGEVTVEVLNPDGGKAIKDHALFYGEGSQAWVFRLQHGFDTLVWWIHVGGQVMYPILALSIFALALVFHCLFALREGHLIPKRLVEDVAEYLSNGHWENAADYCRKKQCAFGRIVLAGVQKADQQPEVIRDTIASAGARESEQLQQKINLLNAVGVVAPMLGLFGTVWGLQLAFQEIAGAGAQHTQLAAAIDVALHTTVGGLFVGIIAFVAYFLFRGRVVRMVNTMEILAEEMAERIIEQKGEEE